MDSDHLQTLDAKTFAPPESRIQNAGGIRARIAEMKQADMTRAIRRQRQQGMVDGNRPWSQELLDNTGQGDRANLNCREAEGFIDAAKTPYYSLIFRVSRFANIRIDFGEQDQKKMQWSDAVSNRFHTMLDSWNGHDYHTQLRDFQMCLFGIGYPIFEDETPFWCSAKIADVLVPDETPADIEVLDECVILRRVSPIQLFKWVEKEAAAKTQGWLIERVKQAIVSVASSDVQQRWGKQWGEYYQASLRRGDVWWNNKALRIPLAYYLVKEFSGKITKTIMLDNGSVTNSGGTVAQPSILDEDDDNLLFRKIGKIDCFSQVICPFFFDIGTGEWHSIKGLGPKVTDFFDVSNRLFSSILDGAKNGSSLLLQAETASDAQAAQLININGALIIHGAKLVENRIGVALEGPMKARGEVQKILQSNTGQYIQRSSSEDSEPTLGQAQLNYQTQTQLGDAARDRFLKTLDRLYLEQVRRAFMMGKRLRNKSRDELNELEKLVYDFYNKSIDEDGVPEDAMMDFKYVASVKAVRGIGNGSPVSMDLATQQGMAMLPTLNERGRNEVVRMRLAFLYGQDRANAIMPPFDEADLPDSHVWAAAIENIILRMPPTASTLPVTTDQDHVIHFGSHYQDSMSDVQMLQAGQSQPENVLVHLHNSGPHMKMHLDAMAGDPTRKAQLAPMQKAWLALSKVADQLQQNIQEAQKNQQQAPAPVDPALVAAMAKVHGELEIKKVKMMGDLRLKAEKQTATLREKDLSLAHMLRLKNFEAAGVQPNLYNAPPDALPPDPVTSQPNSLPAGSPPNELMPA